MANDRKANKVEIKWKRKERNKTQAVAKVVLHFIQ